MKSVALALLVVYAVFMIFGNSIFSPMSSFWRSLNIFGTAGTGKIAGIVIGLTLTLVHLVGIRLTGTSVNPARSIATAFADLIYNGSTEALAQVWMFIVAPLVGAIVTALLYKTINTEKE